MAALDDAVDRLYGLPLDEFTRERTALARELRKAGEKEAAEAVAALRKPPVPVWAVNQIARSDPEGVEELIAAAARLREAQTGGGDFPEALREERAVLRRLVGEARALLDEAGRGATDATLVRLERTLEAAAARDDTAEALRHGTLQEEVEPAGFGGLLGAAPSAQRPAEPKGPSRRELLEEARRTVAGARGRAKAELAAAREAAQACAEAERAWREAREEAQRAASRAERAEADAAEAQRRLAELREG